MVEESEAKVDRLPKIELHLHVEGAIRRSTLIEFAEKLDVERSMVDGPAWAGRSFRYRDLPHFITTMQSITGPCLRLASDYERTAYELFMDMHDQGVIYTEASFDPTRGIALDIPFDDMLGAMNRGKERAIRDGCQTKIGYLVAFARRRGADVAAEFAQKAAESRDLGVVGIDIHGDESAGVPADFIRAYEIAKEAGLGLRAHAGEGVGPESVWGAVKDLGVTRVAHGLRSREDPALVKWLIEHRIVLDMAVSSNVKLNLVPTHDVHPIREYFDMGMPVSAGADDPLFFDTDVNEEYKILHSELGFTFDELKQVTLYAIEGSFISEAEKAELRAKTEALHAAV